MTTPAERAKQRQEANPHPFTPGPRRISKEEYRDQQRAHTEREREIRNDFADDLAVEHGLFNFQATAKKVFDFAWDQGHSEGYWRVEDVYEEIAEIALVAVREGRG